jgi:hypothetical protein
MESDRARCFAGGVTRSITRGPGWNTDAILLAAAGQLIHDGNIHGELGSSKMLGVGVRHTRSSIKSSSISPIGAEGKALTPGNP